MPFINQFASELDKHYSLNIARIPLGVATIFSAYRAMYQDDLYRKGGLSQKQWGLCTGLCAFFMIGKPPILSRVASVALIGYLIYYCFWLAPKQNA
jgi:hypothetical protein